MFCILQKKIREKGIVLNKESKNILAFVSYYLPSYKAGGPVKTIQNMVEQLEGYHFSVVTRDRDLGDQKPFSNIKIKSWEKLEKAFVMYLDPDGLSLRNMSRVINNSDFEVLYLNSFFDFVFTIKPLLASRLGLIKPCPIVLAPRGEFSTGALALNSFKKKLFIKLSKFFKLYQNIIWQASSELEKQDIVKALDIEPSTVFIAKDLPPKVATSTGDKTLKANEICRVVFLSRISPKKNLDFALLTLGKVRSSLIFDIYGPIEDEEYWQSCLKLIEQLPSNIKVNYCDAVKPEQVASIFSSYDLFFFPTRGENYGHVIAESLSSGTPVLLSDQTPWLDMASDELGWDLPLDLDLFAQKIEEVAEMDSKGRLDWRRKVAVNSISKINNDQDITDNIHLFQFAVERFVRKL